MEGGPSSNRIVTATTTIAVDAMGGDNGPLPVIRGIARVCRQNPTVQFVLAGDEAVIARAISRRSPLAGRYETRHAPQTVAMDAKAARAYRDREGTSMWEAINAVVEGSARVAVSCGNTGALTVMAAAALKTLSGAPRPAIAALWPTTTRDKSTVMLDMGAHYMATGRDLCAYAVMGSEYARAALKVPRPRIAVLNIGAEKGKGRHEVRDADGLLSKLSADPEARFDYVGFAEGNQITQDVADVIVTDGFSGNVALKTAEGVANFIRTAIMTAVRGNPLASLLLLPAYASFRGFRNRIDPRRLNGGVLLGLNGVVVKSHGRADAKGIEAAIDLAIQVSESNVPAQIARELAAFEQRLVPENGVKPASP